MFTRHNTFFLNYSPFRFLRPQTVTFSLRVFYILLFRSSSINYRSCVLFFYAFGKRSKDVLLQKKYNLSPWGSTRTWTVSVWTHTSLPSTITSKNLHQEKIFDEVCDTYTSS
jgi:hypothetical protein